MQELKPKSSIHKQLENICVLGKATGINFRNIQTVNIFTIPKKRKGVVTGAIIIPDDVSGLITPATIGIGIAAGEIDIIPATILTNLILGKILYLPTGLAVIANEDEIIKLGITTAAVATTFTGTIYLIGFLI